LALKRLIRMNAVMVKLGGSLLTDKRKKESLRAAVLKRLCGEIHSAKGEKSLKLVVGHGGGSFPHYPAHEYNVNDGIAGKDSLKGFALTNDAAARLNRLVVAELIRARESAVSVQPSAWLIAKGGSIHTSFTEQFRLYLNNGFLPVPYGDAVMDYRRGIAIASTEQVLGELAQKLNSRKMVVVAKTNGVFTDDPLENKDAEFIPLINRRNFPEIRKMLKGSYGTDVTGGMLGKVEALVALAGKGVKCQVISGEKKGYLKRALLGEKLGTVIE